MNSYFHILASDSSLGRVEKSTLSQQTLMELLIQDITNKGEICLEEHDDCSEWDGIDVNGSSEVTEISWNAFSLEGSVDLQWIPPTATFFSVGDNNLKSSIDLTLLPESLTGLQLNENEFSGEISLDRLPQHLDMLDVSFNHLEGSLNLTKLPDTLEDLYCHSNRFSGLIDLTHLPPNLVTLDLHANPLVGSTDFSKLPDSLEYLDVRTTRLEGTVYSVDGRLTYVSNSLVKRVAYVRHAKRG